MYLLPPKEIPVDPVLKELLLTYADYEGLDCDPQIHDYVATLRTR